MKKSRTSFTLLELLVAVTVLSLLMVLFLQISKGIVDTYARGRSDLDNYAASRSLMDAVSRDLLSAVIRKDLPSFPTNSVARSFAFYTSMEGVSLTSVRNLSYVQYLMKTNSTESELVRGDASIGWNEVAKVGFGTGVPPTVTERTLARGILGFDYRFVLKDGSVSATPADLTQIVAVRYTLVAMDPVGFRLLVSSGQLEALRSQLATAMATSSGLSAKLEWDSLLNSSNFTANYPAKIVSGIRVFERMVPLEVENDAQ